MTVPLDPTRVGLATAVYRAESVYDLQPYMSPEGYTSCPCFTIDQGGVEIEAKCWRVAHDDHPYRTRKSDGRCCVHITPPLGLSAEQRRQFKAMAHRLRDLLDAADWYGGWALVIERAA